METYRHSFTFFVLVINCCNVLKVHAQCSGEPKNISVGYEAVSIRLPNSSNMEYGINLDCEWLITSSVGGKVLYKAHDIQISCPDGLSIYDGSNTSASAKRKDECTKVSPISLPMDTTSGTTLFIKFTSDGNATSGKDLGFQFSLISAPDLSHCSTTGQFVELSTNNAEAALTSPGFPKQYSKDVNCTWIIYPSNPDMFVTLTITFLDVEVDHNVPNTCLDRLIIKYGDSGNGTFCGDELFSPPKMTFSSDVGGNITVTLITDEIQQEYGFVAVYNQIDPGASDKNKGNPPMESNGDDGRTTVIVLAVLVPILLIVLVVIVVVVVFRLRNSRKENIQKTTDELAELKDKS